MVEHNGSVGNADVFPRPHLSCEASLFEHQPRSHTHGCVQGAPHRSKHSIWWSPFRLAKFLVPEARKQSAEYIFRCAEHRALCGAACCMTHHFLIAGIAMAPSADPTPKFRPTDATCSRCNSHVARSWASLCTRTNARSSRDSVESIRAAAHQELDALCFGNHW